MNIDKIYPKILIDSFKSQSREVLSEIYGGNHLHFVKCFKSSGTGNQQRRSLSWYSQKGLEVYENNSWKHFESVLHHLQPKFKAKEWVGLSMIPPETKWQDSSLSHMVSYFVKKSHRKSQFLDEISDFYSWMDDYDIHGSNEPVWIFGTAAHYLNWVEKIRGEDNPSFSLRPLVPQGLANRIFLFETGGFKNIRTGLDRESYLEIVSRTFGISSNQIISEYGMCELASQAYDLATFKYGVEERFFHTSRNMNCYVLQRNGKLSILGVGCLVVKDESRVDIVKPMVTQDVVEIWAPNCFRLLGRVMRSDRRGCSLNVDFYESELDESQSVNFVTHAKQSLGADSDCASHSLERRVAVNHDPKFYSRIAQIEYFFDFLKNDSTLYLSFLREFESPFLVTEMIKDLFYAMPKNVEQWSQACIASGMREDARWLIVLPSNHSIAGLQVICLGLVSGGLLQVRVPTEFDFYGSSLKNILDFLVKIFPMQLEIIGSHYRFADTSRESPSSVSYLDDTRAKIIFGGESMMLKSQALIRDEDGSKCFGHKMGSTYLEEINLEFEDSFLQGICHDAFSMLQRGCMSSRYIFLNEEVNVKIRSNFLESLSVVARSYLRGGISTFHGAALDYYAEYLRNKFGTLIKMGDDVGSLFPLITMFEKSLDLKSILDFMEFERDRAPLCSIAIIPIKFSGFLDLISSNQSLYYIYTNSGEKLKAHFSKLEKEISLIGNAHRSAWNGRHEGKRIFV